MKRTDLQELHYITPMQNVPSILKHGILSNKLAAKVSHQSCASQGVQERRSAVTLSNGRPLHDYVNLYFNARNPMMYLLKDNHPELTVLAINPDVLSIPGVIISDQNAARDYAMFKSAPDGLEMIDKDLIFAESWVHPDDIKTYEHKGAMCAEVLVLDKVNARFVLSAYVSCNSSQSSLISLLGPSGAGFVISINSHLFFQ